MSKLELMLEGKPERYKQMVKERLDRANGYASKARGVIASRQVIATIMVMVDDIYTETEKDREVLEK